MTCQRLLFIKCQNNYLHAQVKVITSTLGLSLIGLQRQRWPKLTHCLSFKNRLGSHRLQCIPPMFSHDIVCFQLKNYSYIFSSYLLLCFITVINDIWCTRLPSSDYIALHQFIIHWVSQVSQNAPIRSSACICKLRRRSFPLDSEYSYLKASQVHWTTVHPLLYVLI